MQAGVTDGGWSPAAGNSHPREAALGFGSVPKAGRRQQQAEAKGELVLGVLVQPGAHRYSTTRERLGALFK